MVLLTHWLSVKMVTDFEPINYRKKTGKIKNAHNVERCSVMKKPLI